MMKANVVTAHGAADAVFSMQSVPDPVAGAYDLLVKVLTTSVNPLDCRIRSKASVPRVFPLILGYDVCGIVVDKGTAVSGFGIGDRVIGSPSPFRPGANAEYVAIDFRCCAHAGSLDDVSAAAIPLVGITAYEALFDRLQVSAGDLVVIHAGAGGVGHLAVQLARNAGCRVVTTAGREASLAYCSRELQADLTLDYRQTNLVEAIMDLTAGEGAPLILDAVGGATFHQCLDYAAYGGHICTIVPVPVAEAQGYAMLLKNITLSYQFMGGPRMGGPRLGGPRTGEPSPGEPASSRPSQQAIAYERQGAALRQLVEMAALGRIRPHVSQVFDWTQLVQAHKAVETGHTLGKVVVRVSDRATTN